MCNPQASPEEKKNFKSQFKPMDDKSTKELELMASNGGHKVVIGPEERAGGGRNPFGIKTPEMQALEDDYFRRNPNAPGAPQK